MASEHQNNRSGKNYPKNVPKLFDFAGYRYWTASLLPAIVGTTLPFWLRPQGFSFDGTAAIEFLIAAVLFHSGFSFLQAHADGRSTITWSGARLLGAAVACIITGCLIGLHLNNGLTLHTGVPRGIFMVYGITALFTGVLYVAPPFRLRHQAGGEVVLSVGLGLVPVLGAYLVQVGDITRRVYLAALPLVVSTGLWLWTTELMNRVYDEKAGHRSMVMIFSPRFSGRYMTLALVVLVYATLILAVFVRSSLPLPSLMALLSFGLALGIAHISWNDYANEKKMRQVCGYAFLIHLITGVVISASSLTALL